MESRLLVRVFNELPRAILVLLMECNPMFRSPVSVPPDKGSIPFSCVCTLEVSMDRYPNCVGVIPFRFPVIVPPDKDILASSCDCRSEDTVVRYESF